MVEVDCDTAVATAGKPLFDAEHGVDDEHATGHSEQLQEQPLAWCCVPTPGQPRGGNAVELSQAEDVAPGIAGDSSQKQGRTNSRRPRTMEINSLAEWYSVPCYGPNPVFDEGDAEGHAEALPLTPASSLPTPTSVSGSRSSSPEPSSPSSHGAKRLSPTDWCFADGVLQSGRTPNTQDLCLRSPRARTPAASPARHASRLAGAPSLPTLMGSQCGVSFGMLRIPGGNPAGSNIEKFAAGTTAAGGLSSGRRSRNSLGGGSVSMTPRVFTPRVWVSGGSRAQSHTCFVWQEVLSMVGSLLCSLTSRCGGSNQGLSSVEGIASMMAPAPHS